MGIGSEFSRQSSSRFSRSFDRINHAVRHSSTTDRSGIARPQNQTVWESFSSTSPEIFGNGYAPRSVETSM